MNTHPTLSGIEATVRGAWSAGAGYVVEYVYRNAVTLSTKPPLDDGFSILRAPDAVSCVETAVGIAEGGVRALALINRRGIQSAIDALADAAGAVFQAGLVVAVIEDEPASALVADPRPLLRAARIPILEPAGPVEVLSYVDQAFRLSEQFTIPITVHVTRSVIDTCAVCSVPERRTTSKKGISTFPAERRTGPSAIADIERRIAAVETFANQSFDLNAVDACSPDVGIIAAGIAYRYAKEVLPTASFLKLGVVHPLPRKMVSYFTGFVKRLYVIEDGEPFIEEQLRAAGFPVSGRDVFPHAGELSLETVAKGLASEGAFQPAISIEPLTVEASRHGEPTNPAYRSLLSALRNSSVRIMGFPENTHTLQLAAEYGFARARGKGPETPAAMVIPTPSRFLAHLAVITDLTTADIPLIACIIDCAGTDLPTREGIDIRKLCEGIGISHVSEVPLADERAITEAVTAACNIRGISVIRLVG
ncbi:MAG: hypothetical protein QHI48_05090 [Bacteroidota bacterium]|nr:hypothetical protein [Bacteroidota bacterium]